MGGRPIVHTGHGHELGDVVSALQKSIRRGLVDDALYWAVEMDLAGYDNYCWTRLLVMTSEDVGPINIHLAQTIRALFETWQDLKKKKNEHAPERLMLVHAVIALCWAVKSRLVDHALIVHYADHDHLRRDVPDYALDGHTRRGRIKGRGPEFFYEVGAEVFPRGWESFHPQVDPAKDEPEDHWRDRARELQEQGVKLPAPKVKPR